MVKSPMSRAQLEKLNRDELRSLAKERKIAGYSSKRKDELIDCLAGEERVAVPVGADRMVTDSSTAEDVISVEAASPYWIRVMWTLTAKSVDRAVHALGADWHQSAPVIRVHSIPASEYHSGVKQWAKDVPIPARAREWFINVEESGTRWQLEIGYLSRCGEFYSLAHSAPIELPQEHRVRSGDGVPSIGAPRMRELESTEGTLKIAIDMKMLIQGVTNPDACLVIDEEQIDVGADGSFQIEQPLPDGRTAIPVIVELSGVSRQRALLAIERNTRFLEPERLTMSDG